MKRAFTGYLAVVWLIVPYPIGFWTFLTSAIVYAIVRDLQDGDQPANSLVTSRRASTPATRRR